MTWNSAYPEGVLTEEETRNIRFMVDATATLLDQTTGEVIPYDIDRVAPYLQSQLLDYYTIGKKDDEGYNKWMVVLGSRQCGKSWTSAIATAYHIAANPGTNGAIVADTKERAETLFQNIITNHAGIPEGLQPLTIPNRESRQITYSTPDGLLSKVKTLSAEGNVGIGRAPDALHLSELPFMGNAAKMWNQILPSIVNRKEARLIMESTPAPTTYSSAEWYKDICLSAKQGQGRFEFVFSPFFASLLCERRWDPQWSLTPEEHRLLSKHGNPSGLESDPGNWRYLTLENLAFRRTIMENDAEVRRYPELFAVFYPSDTVSCWGVVGGGAIPKHVLQKHVDSDLTPWRPNAGYQEYKPPETGAQYVLGADPAGMGGGDQASFHVLEVWGDRWEQVATFASNEHDPLSVALLIAKTAKRYNDAVVIVENNGAGLATLLPLQEATRSEGNVIRGERVHVKNLYYSQLAGRADTRPGIPATAKSKGEALAYLIDALMDTLILHDELTVDQLQSYKRDAEVAQSDKWSALNPGETMRNRREKHHWDRVSALGWAVYAARRAPQRYRPRTFEEQQADTAALEQAIANQDYLHADSLWRKEKERKKKPRTLARFK